MREAKYRVMLALRLFLPESWASDRARLKRAGVPVEYRAARTKPEMALAEIDRVIAAGVRFGCVLADAGYGLSAPFRQGLTARKLAWAVGIPRHLKVYPADVQMIWPVAGRGRPRKPGGALGHPCTGVGFLRSASRRGFAGPYSVFG